MTSSRTLSKPLKWRIMSLGLRTIGRTSDGIALGFLRGFDSGEMLDYVYENRARGRFLLGKLVDRIYLNAVGWRGIRARKEVLKSVLAELLLKRGQGQSATTILDIASGPGRYLQEVCLELRPRLGPDRLTVICRDLDASGLERGRRRAESLGLANFRYEAGDACDPAVLATAAPRPVVVVASGLYELLEEPLIRRSMQGVHQLLPEGGRFVFTTQVHHPQLELIANTLTNRNGEPWVMVCRPLEQVEGWAREAGFAIVKSQMERVGLFAVTLCEKGQGRASPLHRTNQTRR